ncbi:MAG: xanthine dehydrogenase family protein molybdopterin-binding subunit [Betaproteobacteria bacterium]|nr:MAG: xanthine dehydrogenase family protein molybdopterin-binding subunit [Betaproteobacteria bacterium]
MTTTTLHSGVTRRQFMVGAAGLSFTILVDGCAALRPADRGGAGLAAAPADGSLKVNAWASLSTDGTIYIANPAVEMGQGSQTAIPLIIAEEMDADWSRVVIVPAAPDDKIYGNPGFRGLMYTAGSATVTGYWDVARTFGAQVRRVMMENAARKWDVPLAELSTEPSTVVHAKTGRRTSYGEIAAFAQIPATAPTIKPEELKKPGQYRLIGKDVMRVELPTKVNGTAQYSIDVQLPGMLYGAVLRGPVEGAAPASIDDAQARAVAGVVRIVRMPFGVGVIAETPWAAFEAKNALKVTWDRRARAFGHDSDKAIPVYSAAARDLGRAGKPWDTAGDARSAIQKAVKTYESEYVCDYSYHAQMEPLNSVASVSPAGDACEIWCGTQSQTMAVAAVAKALGIPVEKVKLNLTLLGGGFGRRGHRDEEFVVDSVLLSKEVKRPVKVLWTREDDVHNGRFRPLSVHFLRAGLDSSNRIVAWQHRVACDEITAFQDPVRYKGGGEKDFLAMAGSELRTYAIPNRLSEQLPQVTGIRTSSLRGIGFGPNKFATEAFLDEVAAKHGLDPVELRVQLLKNTPRGQAVIRAVVEMSDYRRARPGRGLGFSFIDYAGTMVAAVAEVSIDKTRGKVNVHDFWLALDPGIAVQPDNVVAQTESSIVYGLGLALTERITIKDGAVQQSNILDYGVPRMHDIPELHIRLMSTPNRPTGAGQMATPIVAPAISSAVFAASGARVRHMPFLPGRVLAAMA